jgi:hypothetical protein
VGLEVKAPASVVLREREFVEPEFEPVEIPGEPMSEMIKRGRR